MTQKPVKRRYRRYKDDDDGTPPSARNLVSGATPEGLACGRYATRCEVVWKRWSRPMKLEPEECVPAHQAFYRGYQRKHPPPPGIKPAPPALRPEAFEQERRERRELMARIAASLLPAAKAPAH